MLVMASFGERLRRLREERHISRAVLARKAELDPSYIFRLERGEHPRASGKTLEALARALGISMDELLDDERHSEEVSPEQRGAEEVEDAIRTLAREYGGTVDQADMQKFLERWVRLPSSVKRLIQLQAETYSGLVEDLGKKEEEAGQLEGDEAVGG